MRIIFASLILSLSSCAMPEFPQDVRDFTLITILKADGSVDFDRSYGFCPTVGDPSNKIRVSAQELFKGKYFATSTEDRKKIDAWRVEVENWGLLNCRMK